jgi:manganese/zinc/iron transport system permease protein
MDTYPAFIWSLDGWILCIGGLCALNTALLGNFLLLRRMSMLGDAISHAILPGLALAFIIFESRDSTLMLIGASLFGVLTVVLTEWLRGRGKVDEGAALGIVFVGLFALGLLLIVRAADTVDLDPSCVLFGSIELAPLSTIRLFGFDIPVSVPRLLGLLCINVAFISLCYKELLLSSFDEAFAEAEGCRPRLLHYIFLSLVALTAVISFEIVGNILVVAMFVVPPACAHLLSRRLKSILLISLFFALMFSTFGHLGAVFIPPLIGFQSTSTAGMIATVSGVAFIFLLLFSPSRGVVSTYLSRSLERQTIKIDDFLAEIFRGKEDKSISDQSTQPSFWIIKFSILTGLVIKDKQGFHLTDKGLKRAEQIIRSHRLWESYLSEEAGYESSQVHGHADGFEHYTDSGLQEKLHSESKFPDEDPHGRKIP